MKHKDKPTKPTLSAADKALFKQAVMGTTPLHHDTVIPHAVNHKPSPSSIRIHQQQTIVTNHPENTIVIEDSPITTNITANQSLCFARTGIQIGVLKKLKRGHYTPVATLDLHGKTRTEAREALQQFLMASSHAHHRYVRIIHGKGSSSDTPHAILKTGVNHWLKQHPLILAFCSAPRRDGGTGAIYALLKNT